jgi:glutamate racemase
MKYLGMFDSGIGGLTVLKAVQEKLPHEVCVYLADTARMPYGEKSPETVLRYSIENAVFLMEQNIKILINACNTSSSVSIEKLREIFNIPVVGVIEPGAEKAAQTTKTGSIAVLATKGTIQSGAYQRQLQKLAPDVRIIPIACPLLALLVEEGFHAHLATRLILSEYLEPLKHHPVDTILLGCTHYPPLAPLICEILNKDIHIVDSATTCAEKVEQILEEKGWSHQSTTGYPHKFFASDDPEKFQKLGARFLGRQLPQVALKSLFLA